VLWRSVQAQSTLESSKHPQPSASGHLKECLLFVLGVATAVLLQAAPVEADTVGPMRVVAGESALSRKEPACGAHLQPCILDMSTAVSVTGFLSFQ
jgi:hypothetical protein